MATPPEDDAPEESRGAAVGRRTCEAAGEAGRLAPTLLFGGEVSRERPRMLVSRSGLATLKANCKGPGKELLLAMKRRADGMLRSPALLDNNGRHYLPTYAFLYLVTGEKVYAEKAKEWLRLLAERTIENPWTCLEYIPAGSFAYDWIHPTLTREERRTFAEGLIRQVTRITKLWRHSDYNNHFLLEHMSQLHVGLALAHEDHHQEAWRGYLSRGEEWLVKHVVPAMNEMAGPDGGCAEGFSYANWGVERPLAFLLLAWRSAIGESLFEDCSFLRCAPRWNVYGRKPDGRMCRSEDCPSSHEWAQLAKPAFSVCATAYEDPLAQWIRDEIPSKYPQLIWADLVAWDPRVRPKGPQSLPLATVFRPLGHVYTRSAWEEEDATFAMFQCGPIFAGHQHLDNNSFVIHKRGMLAIDSGVNEYSSHRANYYSRTVAHNSIVVFDPKEVFPKEVWSHAGSGGSNDGGQRRVDFPGRVTASRGEKARRDVGRIVAFRNRDEYAYACGDATDSYAPGKVRLFTRQFVHLRPDTFVIFDRVESTSAKFRKSWLLHSIEKPFVAAGERAFHVEEGQGRLDVLTLLPRKSICRAVGGPGREFLVDGRNYPPDGKQDPGAGGWRVEVSPAEAATRDCFLHVLFARDRDDRSPLPGVKLVSDTTKEATLEIDFGNRKARLTFKRGGKPGGRLKLTGARGRGLAEAFPISVEVE